MSDFLQSNEPPFYYLQFIFEKLTYLNDVDQKLFNISITSNLSKCILCSNHEELDFTKWTQKSKDFAIGKSLIVDGKTSELEILLETSDGFLNKQILINDIENAKPTRRIIELLDSNNVPIFQLQCILVKRSLHFQSNLTKNQYVETQNISSQTNTINQLSIGTQTESRVQFKEVGVNSTHEQNDQSTQTTEPQITPHQRQIMMRMAILLVNKVCARLLEYQMNRKIGQENVASKLVNTDFTLPTTMTEINNSIRVEHLQDIKKRLQQLSKQHRTGLMAEEKSKQLTRVKRICRPNVEKPKGTTKISDVKMPITQVKEKEQTKKDESVQVEEKHSERESVKSWISSLHSNLSPKLESVKKSGSSIKSEAKSSIDSEASSSTQSRTSSESSDEISEEEEDSQSETSGSESESEEEEETSKTSSNSIHEKIERSTGSSIPTEIGSNVSVSDKSYLESVASSSNGSETPKKKNELSPTSEYLQKLRADVLRKRT